MTAAEVVDGGAPTTTTTTSTNSTTTATGILDSIEYDVRSQMLEHGFRLGSGGDSLYLRVPERGLRTVVFQLSFVLH